MSLSDVTVTALADYRTSSEYPFCPGCGHGTILDALNRAFTLRGVDPAGVVLVTDIGCAGLSDEYFATSAFHGLHGRAITYASGIKLARPDLDVVVLMGDGGTGIGGAHLLSAARRNIGITVLVFNNLNFGMTGGQHSVTTPEGAVTVTTPGGHLERPLDICATVAVNGAGFVYRGTSFDADLGERIAAAMGSDGFALLDVWELCSAYFMRSNRFGKRSIMRTLDDLGFATGMIAEESRPEYTAASRAAAAGIAPGSGPGAVAPVYEPPLARPTSLVLAGSAGGRVRSAGRVLGQAAILSGLWAVQRDDYPVTVRTGHSVASVILSPEPIDHTGVTRPDVLVLISPDGAAHTAAMAAGMTSAATVYSLPGAEAPPTPAAVRHVDTAQATERLGPAETALAAVATIARERSLVPFDALVDAAALLHPAHGDRTRRVIAAGWELATRTRLPRLEGTPDVSGSSQGRNRGTPDTG